MSLYLCVPPLLALLHAGGTLAADVTLPPSCQSKIYCSGELLDDVQMSRLYKDSKTFVDKRLLFEPDEVISKYEKLKSEYEGQVPPIDVLQTFVDSNFEDGNELDAWVPTDWTEEPSIVKKVRDPALRNWTSSLNAIWRTLSRKVDEKVKLDPQLYSIIYVPNGFIIPGGRFKELYYWDTYWIVKGLLICDMVETARGVIENLFYILKQMGHVPNGSRVYYAARTQPPILTQMVYAYFKRTKDLAFVKKYIHLLDEEMDYWVRTRQVEVKISGMSYKLFRYYAPSAGPRPESYREDVETASFATSEAEKQEVYTSLKSGAESGWDFSTRWFVRGATNQGNISDISTSTILPVDLNALLYKDFTTLTELYVLLGDLKNATKYRKLSKEVISGINNVLWNDEEGIWCDYDMVNKVPRKYFYMSNFVPLWTKAYSSPPWKMTKLVMKYIDKVNLTQYIGGSPTSLMNSGEQWDYPNAWPPLQAFFIQGLDKIGTPVASKAAFEFAQTYLRSNYIGFRDFGVMYEKYDALLVGRTGAGGEYDAQSGFGWTNGFALEILDRWGAVLRATHNEVGESQQVMSKITA